MAFIRFDTDVEPLTPPLGKAVIYVDISDNQFAVKKDDGSVQKFMVSVTSINGFFGIVTLDTNNIPENTNLYYTQGRFDVAFNLKTTDNLSEGATNLYFTNTRADSRITLQKGAANGLATLGADSKIPSSQLASLAITSTFVVNSEAAQLALTAQEGDIAVRSDINETFVQNGGISGTITDWTMLLTPTDSVISVNGNIGVVVLTTSNINEGSNLYYTDIRVSSNATVVANTAKISADGSINTHNDVDMVTIVPNNKDILQFDGTNWIPKSKHAIKTVTANYSVVISDETILVDATTSGLIITLPLVSILGSKVFNIKKIDVTKNNVIIKGNGTELIDGGNTIIINEQYNSIRVQNDGSQWYII